MENLTLDQLADLVARVRRTEPVGRRRLVAIAGGPASGKSTLAARLVDDLNAAGSTALVVPMDGFHLDNGLLEARNLLARKGAPQTFDSEGFVHIVSRLRDEDEVIYPLFDRPRDIAIAGVGCVDATCDTVVVEGNYLLFDAAPWRDLAPLWDLSIRLVPSQETLRARLISRWLAHGLSQADAEARAQQNDLPNAAAIADAALPADITLAGE